MKTKILEYIANILENLLRKTRLSLKNKATLGIEFNESNNGTISLKGRHKYRLRWNPSQSAIPSIITLYNVSYNKIDLGDELAIFIANLSQSVLIDAGIYSIRNYSNFLIGGFTVKPAPNTFIFIGWEVPNLDENIISQIKAYIKK